MYKLDVNDNNFYITDQVKMFQGYRCESGISIFTWKVT